MIGVTFDGDYFIIKRFRKGLKPQKEFAQNSIHFIIKRFRKGLKR